MNVESLLDAGSALIVIGGTLIATLLRSGFSDCRVASGAIAALFGKRFDAQRARSELSVQIREIREDGLLRADPHPIGDREFDEVTDALIGHRSLTALHEAHEAHRRRRMKENERAVQVLSQATELAPIFGLAGTLLSLAQLPEGGIAAAAYAGTISMAVLTTLYGLLLANLVLAPLARIVERAAIAEEREREQLVEWLASQLASAMPRPHVAPLREAV